VPIDIELRDKVGISLEETRLDSLAVSVEKLLCDHQFSAESMEKLRDMYIYNIGKSGKAGAKYIIDRLVEMQK
jgi:YidC/Oxa1 family membrane protein insertase